MFESLYSDQSTPASQDVGVFFPTRFPTHLAQIGALDAAAGFNALSAFVAWQQNGLAYVVLAAVALSFPLNRLGNMTKVKLSALSVEAEPSDGIADAKATVVQPPFLVEQQVISRCTWRYPESYLGGGDRSVKAKMRADFLSMSRDVRLLRARIEEAIKVDL